MAQPARLEANPTLQPEPRPVAAEDPKRSFLRMVSHELRTPLNSIIGFSEIISHELCGPLGSPQYKEYASLIGSSGHRMLKLVNQILEIVRLEGDTADLDIHAEHLEPIIRDAFSQLREDAEAAQVRLAIDAPDSLPDALCDPRAMQTVLVNLLQNAIRHSPPGSLVVVGARRCDRQVRLHVVDQGEGVPPEDLIRIQRPFEQVGPTLTRHAEGAGLGLPIVRLLCHAMKGELELRSAPGSGLTALVSLPAA